MEGRPMRVLTWTNYSTRGARTHAVVGEATTWCGRFVPADAVTLAYEIQESRALGPMGLPFDCQSCEKAWLSRPRKGKR
jgi:hypothetical protein